MAAYKLEDNIREKLETREIKPSADAWKKLETKLNNVHQPKKKAFSWYYIAASFIGVILLSSVFLNRGSDESKSHIVNENIERQNNENQPEIITKNTKKERIASEEINSEKVNPKLKKSENRNPIELIEEKKSVVDKNLERKKAIANAAYERDHTSKTEISNAKQEDILFNQKVDEVVASVKKLQENKAEVTAMEVEQLLEDARRDIQTQQILSTPKVDAAALLQDVEWELEKSFRDKVFDALGEGFKKIRTAVIERND